MRIYNKIKQTGTWGFFLMCMGALSVSSCREEIDTSDLYTFTGETVSSFLSSETNKDTYSYYYELLQNVRQSTHTQSSVANLLSARGNYTCFAPTNDAITAYLDTAVNIETTDFQQFMDSVKKEVFVYDSIAKVIVYNSIIDNGSDEAYETAVFPTGTFNLPNMNDRYLTASTTGESGEKMTYVINGKVKITQRDKKVENGYVHQVDGVIAPTDASVFDLLQGHENMQIFSALLRETGWGDSLTKYVDEEYEEIYPSISTTNMPKPPTQEVADQFIPEHRKYGFTVFAETDETFQSAFASEGITGSNNIENLKAYLQKKYQNHATFKNLTWGTTSADLKDPMKNNAQAVRSGRIAYRKKGDSKIQYVTVRQYPAQLAVLHIKYDVHTMKEVRDTFYIERILEKKHMSWGFEKYWSFITDDLIASGRWDGLSNTRKLYQVAVEGDKWGVKAAYPDGIPDDMALGYMLGKNRDRDGDEKVGYDEIMWYIPALKELELLYDALNDGYLNFESNDDIFHCSTPSSADPDGVTVGFSYYVKMNNGKYGIGQRDRKYNVIGLRRKNNEWSGPDAGNANFTVTVETGWTDEELVMPKY